MATRGLLGHLDGQSSASWPLTAFAVAWTVSRAAMAGLEFAVRLGLRKCATGSSVKVAAAGAMASPVDLLHVSEASVIRVVWLVPHSEWTRE